MRLVLLGATGSGKGTQAKLLMAALNIPQISTSELLRAAVEAHTPLGRQAKAIMDTGQQIPNDLVLGMIRERLSNPDAMNGFILDGFPRNVEQAEQLDALLHNLSMPIQKSILIEVDFDNLMQRLTGRLTCLDCHEVFNTFTNPPSLDEECDACGGKLHHRSDDNEETISRRLRIYEKQTKPVADYYLAQKRLSVIQGNGEIKRIFSDIKIALKSAKLASSLQLKPAAPKQKPPVKPIQVKSIHATSNKTNKIKPKKADKQITQSSPNNTAHKKIIEALIATQKTAEQYGKPLNTKKTDSSTTHKKAKPAPKKNIAKKKQPQKAPAPLSDAQQLVQLQSELKQVNAEITQIKQRCEALLYIETNKDIQAKRFAEKWQREYLKAIKKLK